MRDNPSRRRAPRDFQGPRLHQHMRIACGLAFTALRTFSGPRGTVSSSNSRHMAKRARPSVIKSRRSQAARHVAVPGATGTHPVPKPTTALLPPAITSKDSAAISVGVSGHSAAGDSVTGTLRSAFAVDSAPGPFTPTAIHDETLKELLAPLAHTLS